MHGTCTCKLQVDHFEVSSASVNLCMKPYFLSPWGTFGPISCPPNGICVPQTMSPDLHVRPSPFLPDKTLKMCNRGSLILLYVFPDTSYTFISFRNDRREEAITGESMMQVWTCYIFNSSWMLLPWIAFMLTGLISLHKCDDSNMWYVYAHQLKILNCTRYGQHWLWLTS